MSGTVVIFSNPETALITSEVDEFVLLTTDAPGPSGPAGLSAVADIAFSFQNGFTSGEILPGIGIAHGVVLDAAASVAKSVVAPTSAVTFTVFRNDDQIGTVTFGAGQKVGSVTLTGNTLSPGDMIFLIAPSPADPTLASVVVTFAGSDA